jgi:hydrogenase nickel incorporation protein HypA/HybF
MHELSLAGAVVATVERHARGRPVAVVNLRIGRLRQVVPDSLEFYFGFVAKGTVCEGARVEIEEVPAQLRCEACGKRWELAAPPFQCPDCGGVELGVEGGDELEVESIEMEEETCIAHG